jgi:H+/Cl- antiporter ClcA
LTGEWYASKLLGTLACLGVGFVGLFVPALVLGAALILVLVAVIVAGYLAPRSREEGTEKRQG